MARLIFAFFVIFSFLLQFDHFSYSQDSNQINYNKSVRGPKIFGLQIGMPFSQAKEIVNDIANKYSAQIDKYDYTIQNDKNLRELDLKENWKGGFKESYGITQVIEIGGNDDTLLMYNLPFFVFNFDPRSNSLDSFLNQLADKYKLTLQCNKMFCNEINEQLEYRVHLTFNNVVQSIKVSATPAPNKLNFE